MIQILFMGKTADIASCSTIELDWQGSLDTLRSELNQRYDGLAKLPIRIAVNAKLQPTNYQVQAGDIVALLPPFAGG